ncbi:MAG: hypothetical protein IKW58_01880 [Alphaproteobacteria bacterium]|nr:hypothetical protein [Alphaproteobacteria bacterium]
MNNLTYFNQSCTLNIKTNESNPEGLLVISKNPRSSQNNLEKKNNQLIEYIITYKQLKSLKNPPNNTIKDIIAKIISIIETTPNINYSPLCSYMQVLKTPYNQYIKNYHKENRPLSEKISFFENILDNYIANRHNYYTLHGYTNITLQTMADASSSRRNGKTGIKTLEQIFSNYNFKHSKTYDDFISQIYSYILPDKGDTNIFITFLNKQKIKFDFRKEHENKNPDVLLKIKKHYFIIEHKLASGQGGSQNAEINEIISFIKGKEKLKNLHYISCLDGTFFSYFATNKNSPKQQAQISNITQALKENPNNYFLNSNLFEKLLKNIL